MQNKEIKMDKKALERYKRKLLKAREELVRKLIADYNSSKTSEREIAQDIADQALDTYSKEFLYSLSNTDREQLLMINEALNRIDESTYGLCLRCGRKIATKRLDAIPWAKYCIECQEKLEEGE
jgi:DnaK suppressor protein